MQTFRPTQQRKIVRVVAKELQRKNTVEVLLEENKTGRHLGIDASMDLETCERTVRGWLGLTRKSISVRQKTSKPSATVP